MALTNFASIVEQMAQKKGVYMTSYLRGLIDEAKNKLNKKEIDTRGAIEIVKKDKDIRIKLNKEDWWWIEDNVR